LPHLAGKPFKHHFSLEQYFSFCPLNKEVEGERITMKKEKKKAPDNHQRDAEGDRKKPDEKALVSTRLVPCRHVIPPLIFLTSSSTIIIIISFQSCYIQKLLLFPSNRKRGVDNYRRDLV
jgi:hypothetical protein